MTLAAGTRLGPYEISSPLGAGGMGEVYRARDRKLDRDVAVKVLPEAVAGNPEALARFEREAKAIAALSHPNILAIFDFGTHEGITYAVTELLEGETLRSRLASGPIPQKQAVEYALQIAGGLAAAHERGIVHRDLKPENVFITRDGHVKILDFGLATRRARTSVEELTSAPTEERHTEPGTVMGTAGYMSPEQVRGLPVDHRSDVFSFGVVLYEMLSGRRPFHGDTPADTMSAILTEEPPELSASGRTVAAALDRIVHHCLEKDRDRRFHSARDIAFALSESSAPAPARDVPTTAPLRDGRVILLGSALVVALVVVGVWLGRRPPKAGGAAAVKRIAVLPFENLGAPEDDYFADGMADEIRGKLTSVPGLEVIARASSNPYKKTAKTPKQIGQELEVEYLLTATLRWQKGGDTSRVHVTPELVELKSSGAPASKWQQSFVAPLTDVFQVQTDIASRVVNALGVALGAGEQKLLSTRPTQNLAAYEAFLKGEEVWEKGGEWSQLQTAIDFYEQAVALDPGFAQGWAKLSLALSHHFDANSSPAVGERSGAAAKKAIALAPDSGEGYLALGYYRLWVEWDETGALEQFEKGQRLTPRSSDLLMARALVAGRLGRLQTAEELVHQAERVDPRSVDTKVSLASFLGRQNRYAEARRLLERALVQSPANVRLIQQKAVTYLFEGNLAAARAWIRASENEVSPAALVAYVAQFGDFVWVLEDDQRELLLRLPPIAFEADSSRAMCLVQVFALKGDAASVRKYAREAERSLRESLLTAPYNAETHAILGLALAYQGRKDEAIREGTHAVALRPAAKNALDGPYYQHLLAKIYTVVGEPEKAIDNLDDVLKSPSELTVGLLRIDPTFDPLRTNPRFRKLVGRSS